jgi:hypothetical protein
MKGVSYLVNDKGEKTHVVLDLTIWHGLWAQLSKEQTMFPASEEELAKARQPGWLNPLLLAMGYSEQDLDEMNRQSMTEALHPLSDEELGLEDDAS